MSNSPAIDLSTTTAHSEGWFILGFGVVATSLMMVGWRGDLGMQILAMVILWLFAVSSVRFEVSHPFVWFGGVFLMYSVAGPTLAELGIHPLDQWTGYMLEELNFSFAMELQFIGMATALLFIGPRRMSFELALRDENRFRFYGGVFPVMALAAILVLASILEIQSQGFVRKIDVIKYGSWITRLGFAFNIVVICVAIYLVKHFRDGNTRNGFWVIAIAFAAGVIFVLLTGQRNFLFRTLFAAFFVVHIAYKPISFRTFLLFAVIGSVLVFVMQGLKLGVAAGGVGSIDLKELVGLELFERHPEILLDPPLIRYAKLLALLTFGSEFMTAGNNLALLVLRVPSEFPFQNGATLLNDIFRAISPGFLLSGQEGDNTTFIYNRLFFPSNFETGAGQGFTYVGTGYFNFGIAGVVLLMAVLGLAIRLSYNWASRSAFGLFFFIGLVPVAAFTARSDLSDPISQGLKHVLMPLVLMLIVSFLRRRRGAASVTQNWMYRP